uniref:Uncharacterized protein n=1 Tax=Setaria italica TaxID=4555 RepID=K3ZFS2_SETIT
MVHDNTSCHVLGIDVPKLHIESFLSCVFCVEDGDKMSRSMLT